MTSLNALSLLGIFGLCFVAWLLSENRSLRIFPWRTVITGILLQLVLGAFVFVIPGSRDFLKWFSDLVDVVFAAAEFGARFVFGAQIVPRVYGDNPPLGYIFAFRALPTVVFFSGLMALLYNLGVIQAITKFFAKIFYWVMRLSGAEALSGAANIFVGIEAAIVVKPYLPKMTRSELAAVLACCFGTAASSTLAIYVSFLKPVFPNILGHLISASIMAIPACFVISKILVPETEMPETLGGIPEEDKPLPKTDQAAMAGLEAAASTQTEAKPRYAPRTKLQVDEEEGFDPTSSDSLAAASDPPQETVGGEAMERMSPLDAAIVGALDGVKMAVAIAAVLILIQGFVYLIDQSFAALGNLPSPVGDFFKVVTLPNILGALFLPITALTGVSLEWGELWRSSVIIGRRLFETAIPPYQALAEQSGQGLLSDRATVIISYALSGFAHIASVGIFVGGMIGLIPSRRKDISELGWKALLAGTLATAMIAAVAGVYFTPGNVSILGEREEPTPQENPIPGSAAPSPTASPVAPPSPLPSPAVPAPTVSPSPQAGTPAAPTPATPPPATPTPAAPPPATPTPAAPPPATPTPAAPTPVPASPPAR
jgi:CNT family concentrative nucleoside transporter